MALGAKSVVDLRRYVTKDDIRTFGTIVDRQKALSVDGWLGQEWLAKWVLGHMLRPS
jgi:hypothetical protein